MVSSISTSNNDQIVVGDLTGKYGSKGSFEKENKGIIQEHDVKSVDGKLLDKDLAVGT